MDPNDRPSMSTSMNAELDDSRDDVEELAKSRCLVIDTLPNVHHLKLLQSIPTEIRIPDGVKPPDRMYLHRDPLTKNYDFYEYKDRTSTSPWKGMQMYVPGKLLMTAAPDARNPHRVFWFLERCLLAPKFLETSGVWPIYRLGDNRQIILEFYLDATKVLKKIEDVLPKLNEIYRNRTQFILRMLIQGERMMEDMDVLPIEEYESEPGPSSQADFEQFFTLHTKYRNKFEQVVPMYPLKSDLLNCQLMPYQKDTVRWMMHRETAEGTADPDPVWNRTETIPHGNLYFYPHFGAVTETISDWNSDNYFMEKFSFRGGILADEMGLGKTVQVLALISAHRRGDTLVARRADSPERFRVYGEPPANESVAEQIRIAEKSYAELNSAKTSQTQVWFTPTEHPTPDTVQCTSCFFWCSQKVCGWNSSSNELENGEKFMCPNCVTKSETRRTIGTTLVILPETLIFQWFTEVAKHCSDNIKVMFYFGVKKHGYLQPHEMEKYDVILTTYDTLRGEITYSEEKGARRQLRNEFKPHYVTSSLIHVKFWRVIVDEAQVLPFGMKGHLTRMLLKIHADNWWCVTGTPLVKNVNDLIATFTFLDLYPFCFPEFFNAYIVHQYMYLVRKVQRQLTDSGVLAPNLLMELLGRIMSRKTKEQVAYQMGLPKLVEIEKKICFTAIEERQYKEEKERLKRVVAKILGNTPSRTYLSDLACRDKVLQDLRILRETILTGHNNGKTSGEAGGANYVYAPETVIFRLIHLKKIQIKNHFRNFMTWQMGLAGVYQLGKLCLKSLTTYQEALENYKEVTDAEEYIEKTVGEEDIRRLTGRFNDSEALDELEVYVKDAESEEMRKASGMLKTCRQARKKYDKSRKTSPGRCSPPPPKMARIEEKIDREIAEDMREMQEEEKERQLYSQKLAAIALRPMRMDGTQEVHLILNTRRLQERMHERTLMELTRLHEVFAKFYRVELNCVKELPEEVKEWQKIWQNSLMAPIKQFFQQWKQKLQVDVKTKDFPAHLLYTENVRVNKDVRRDLLPLLPFNPIYDDGGKTRGIRHAIRTCMGGCSPHHEIEQFVGQNSCLPIPEVIWKTFEHLQTVDNKRRRVEEDTMRLIERLVGMSESNSITALLTRKDTDTPTETEQQMLTMLDCKHVIIVGTKEEKENVLAESFLVNPCQVCELYTAIASLQFDAGFINFHGHIRLKSGVSEFINYMAESFTPLNSEECARFLKQTMWPFFDRCQDFVKGFSAIVMICIELLNRFNELQQAKSLITDEQVMEQMQRIPTTDGANLRMIYMKDCMQQSVREMEIARKHLHEIRYLTNLLKEQLDGKANEEPCPICQLLMSSFMVFTCGHRVCHECWDRLKGLSRRDGTLTLDSDQVKCPTCRVVNKMKQVMIAKNGHSEEETVIPGMILSAKMSSAIVLLREIINADDANKIVLFTSVDPSSYSVWRYLQKVLKLARLPYTVMARNSYGKKVVDFEVSNDKKILLCSLSLCANGLNMTGANHIVFLDPPHLRSILLQAIGRINRFGQKREMKVYHMVVEGSLDVELRETAKKREQNPDKDKRGWTCGDVRSMFDIPLPAGERAPPRAVPQDERFAQIMQRMIQMERIVDEEFPRPGDDDPPAPGEIVFRIAAPEEPGGRPRLVVERHPDDQVMNGNGLF